MQVTMDKLEGSKVKLAVEVEAERVNKAVADAYVKVRGQVKIPGFRRGKAPRNILEAYVGKGVLYEEAMEKLLPEVYNEAVKQAKVSPVDQPSVDIEQFEEEKPFIFSAEIVVKPEVTIEGYKGIDIEKKRVEISDEDVEKELRSLQERLATYDVDNEAKAAKGDILVIDFEGTIDDLPFEGGKAEGITLELGAGRFMPEFEDALMNAGGGEERQATITFPEDYHGADVAGKTAVFKIKVNEVRVRKLPEIDDELVKRISASQDVASFREELKTHLSAQAESDVERKMRDDVVEQAAEKAQVGIPEVMIEHEIDHMLKDMDLRLQYQQSSLQNYLETIGKDEAALREDFKPQAESRIKAELSLDTIAAIEELEVPQEEIDRALEDIARKYGQKPEQFAKKVTEDQLAAIKEGILRDKAIEFLLKNANIKEVA
jgi:trigger factor